MKGNRQGKYLALLDVTFFPPVFEVERGEGVIKCVQ